MCRVSADAGEKMQENFGGYTKVFGHRSTTSWIHRSGDLELRGVWDDLLKLADRKGLVRGDYPAIALAMNRPLEMVISKMSILSAAHPESRSQVARGASIVQIELGVWMIVNYERYRNSRDQEQRREQMRQAKRRQRAREKARKNDDIDDGHQVGMSAPCHQNVIIGHQASSPDARQNVIKCHPESSHTDTDKSTPQTPQGGLRRNLFLDLDCEAQKKNAPADPDEEPSGWTDQLLKAAKLQFPEASLPEKFHTLPVDIQRSIISTAKKLP